MFSSISLSTEVSRINLLVRCALWYLINTSLFCTYLSTNNLNIENWWEKVWNKMIWKCFKQISSKRNALSKQIVLLQIIIPLALLYGFGWVCAAQPYVTGMINLVEREGHLMWVSGETRTNNRPYQISKRWTPMSIGYHYLWARIGVIEPEYGTELYSHSYMIIADTTNTNNLVALAWMNWGDMAINSLLIYYEDCLCHHLWCFSVPE